MSALQITSVSINGPMAIQGTCSPIRQSVWAWRWSCKRRATPAEPVQSVDTARKAVPRGETLLAAHADIMGIGMESEREISDTSIVRSLVSLTLLRLWHPPRAYGSGPMLA